MLGIAGTIYRIMNEQPERTISTRVWIPYPPFSADPIDYDSFIHHITFRSVFSSVVTQYKNGEYVGVLAESWRSTPDFKNWTFSVRSGIAFSNGDKISPKSIALSWMRIAFLLKQRESRTGLFEHLVGIEDLSGANTEIAGISTSVTEIVLKFKVPMPKLLETLSFGLYAVVHPKNFDSVSGEWNKGSPIIASGPYSISSWTSDQFVLELRPNFPHELRHSRPLLKVEVSWASSSRESADIIYGSSLHDMREKGFSFWGGAASSIAFVRCQSWSHPESIFHELGARRALRSRFYRAMEAGGFSVVRSFFPLVLKDVVQAVEQAMELQKE